MRLYSLLAAAGILAFGMSEASAAVVTFNLNGTYSLNGVSNQGTFSGTIQADLNSDSFVITSPNVVTSSAGVMVHVSSGNTLIGGGPTFGVTLETNPNNQPPATNLLDLVLSADPVTLANAGSGSILFGDIFIGTSNIDRTLLANRVGGTITLSGTVKPVPLPGALPLFATGLGALGLLGWRRKKKLPA